MSFIQNLFTSRDNNANAETYVGQEGRIWWDPTTNSFYYSDGNTAGGIAIGAGGNPFNQLLNTYNDVTFANLTVTGNLNADLGNISNIANISVIGTANLGNLTISDQTISGTIDGRDVTIATTNSSSNINLAAPINIHANGNLEATPTFQVLEDGQATFRVPTLDANAGAVQIVGSTSGATVPAGNPGGMLQITGQNNQVSRLYNDAISNYALYVGRRYNGTASAPTGVLLNQVVSRVGANPMADNGTFSPAGMAQISFITLENVTPTAQGSKIQMNATPVGSSAISTIAEFYSDRLAMSGNIIPTLNNQYTLGNVTNQWSAIHAGPGGLYLEDLSTGIDAQLTVDSNVFLINNVTALQVGNIQLTKDGIINTQTAGNIDLGTTGDTGWVTVQNAGIEFPDGSQQTTAAIPLTQKGNALGVVPLNGATKIDPIYLPSGAITFKGIWNANTNTPTLADGVGTSGDEYIVGTAGTQNLGSGNITFNVGDFVLYTSANVWEDIPVGGTGVTSFNTRTGAVTLTSGDVTNALSNSSIVNSKLVNSEMTINTGVGLNGGQVIALGGSMTLTADVANIAAGTGVTVTPSAGTYTIAIGQPVGTANTVQFAAISSTTTIQATGNITGGNLTTGGRVVATGNIVTSANVVTPGAIINSSISTSGNIIGANIRTAGLVTATGNITGGNILTAGLVSATGNGTFGNISVVGNTTTSNLSVTGLSNLNSNANVKITGGIPGQSLATDGAGNLFWTSGTGGNTVIINGSVTSNVNIDFTYNSTTLVYIPTANVNITLSNYTAGHTARVIVRYGATAYPIILGIGNVAQSTEGLTTIPISGAGGHNLDPNSCAQLLYTCFDNTAGNCYVASTFL